MNECEDCDRMDCRQRGCIAPVTMTPEQFDVREKEILERLPAELRSALSWLAYDRGHAYGFNEVLGHLEEMTAHLEEPLRSYGCRMKGLGMELQRPPNGATSKGE